MASTWLGRGLLLFGGAYVVVLLAVLGMIALPERCVPPAPCFKPALPEGTRVDVIAYASQDARPRADAPATAFWRARDVALYESLHASVPLPVPPRVRTHNGTLWVHVLVFRAAEAAAAACADAADAPTDRACAADEDEARYPAERLPRVQPLLLASTLVVAHLLPYPFADFLLPSLKLAADGTAPAAAGADAGAFPPPPPPPPPPPDTPAPHYLYAGRALRLRLVRDLHAHASFGLVDGTELLPAKHDHDQHDHDQHDHDRVHHDRVYDGTDALGGWREPGWQWRADLDGRSGGWWGYRPFFYADTFSLLRRHARELSTDASRPAPTLRLEVLPRSLLAHRLFSLAESGMLQASESLGLGGGDLEELRALVGEERLGRLALEQAFGWAHAWLAYYAFVEEVQFWRGREGTVGISARALLVGLGSSCATLVYLFDNRAETSSVLLLTQAADLTLAAWKAAALLLARRRRRRAAAARRAAERERDDDGTPRAQPTLEDAAASLEASTESIDEIGCRLIGLSLAPLGLGLPLYTLLASPHRSWRSWLLDALAKGVYLFGFVSMTPQLFVNYKLKSVAHLPWKVLWYKAFTTFVDDVFACLVPMPTAHRLACLRDDVVFACLLYQRRCYPIDFARANEYGYAYAHAGDARAAEQTTDPAAADSAPADKAAVLTAAGS